MLKWVIVGIMLSSGVGTIPCFIYLMLCHNSEQRQMQEEMLRKLNQRD